LKSLQREHQKHLEREKALSLILDTLRTGYNPNYQDMAVLEAVRGWEELAGLPHINDVGKDKEGENKGEAVKEEATLETEEPLEEGMWTADQLQHQLDGLLNSDYVSLLLEHEEFIQAPVDGAICMCY
jgi:protein kinase C substrate 80K-H